MTLHTTQFAQVGWVQKHLRSAFSHVVVGAGGIKCFERGVMGETGEANAILSWERN